MRGSDSGDSVLPDEGRYVHLRGLPDGSLTKVEVGDLLDAVEGLEVKLRTLLIWAYDVCEDGATAALRSQADELLPFIFSSLYAQATPPEVVHIDPIEVPHCAGRLAVAHERAPMHPLGWRCPVCEETEVEQQDPDIGICDSCGSEEGERRQTPQGWTCAECSGVSVATPPLVGGLLAHPGGHADLRPGRPVDSGLLDRPIKGRHLGLDAPDSPSDALKPHTEDVVPLGSEPCRGEVGATGSEVVDCSTGDVVHASTIDDGPTLRQPEMTDQSEMSDQTPPGLSADEMRVAEALYADTWTTPKAENGPDWHHRLAWWQCVFAARIAVAALSGRSAPTPKDPR
jgi:hypothetical protein